MRVKILETAVTCWFNVVLELKVKISLLIGADDGAPWAPLRAVSIPFLTTHPAETGFPSDVVHPAVLVPSKRSVQLCFVSWVINVFAECQKAGPTPTNPMISQPTNRLIVVTLIGVSIQGFLKKLIFHDSQP